MDLSDFDQKINSLIDGAYTVYYQQKRYMLRKETRLCGKLIKLYAYELGGNNFVSLNYYKIREKELLKPCEMDAGKVIDFVLNLQLPIQ